jgi:hypothetical protein
MDKFTDKYKEFLRESLQDTYKEKISDQYGSLKRGLLDLLDSSIDNPEDLRAFIDNYLENPDNNSIVEFIENDDIFNFYLKFEANIDEICVDNEYFDKAPKENDVFSLYEFLINGTQFALIECLKIMKEELF